MQKKLNRCQLLMCVCIKQSFVEINGLKEKTPYYTPLPSNLHIVDPEHIEKLHDDLKEAHLHAQATDCKGLVEKYGSSTWLTALE